MARPFGGLSGMIRSKRMPHSLGAGLGACSDLN